VPKTTPPGKKKISYVKQGRNYFDIFVDVNGDGVYDRIRIYKAVSTWRKSKKSGIFSAGARANISIPNEYRDKYVKMDTKKRKK